MSHINRRKFITITASAVAAVPLAATGIPIVGETELTTLTKGLKEGYDEGGYFVPSEVAEMIQKAMEKTSPIRFIAKGVEDE